MYIHIELNLQLQDCDYTAWDGVSYDIVTDVVGLLWLGHNWHKLLQLVSVHQTTCC